MIPRTRIATVVALALLLVSTALVPAFGVGNEGGDLDVFYGYAARIVHGAAPYRDVRLEYPPGALAVIVPPALGKPSEHAYAVRFETAMLALFALTIALLARRRARAAVLVGLAPLLLGEVVFKRFDILPALLTLAALVLAQRKRYASSAALLGLGTAVKLYPVLLLPLVAIAAGRRAAPKAIGAFSAACALVFVPFLVLSPHGVVASIHDQVSRHLQIETPLASVALLAHSFGVLNVGVVSESHTYGLGGTSGFVLAVATSLAFLGGLAYIWWRTPSVVRSREGLVLAWAATVCVAVVLGRVLSPQYLIWLLPLVVLVEGRAGRRATALLVAALLLTNVWYPAHYLDVIVHLDRNSIFLLVLRNLVLSALLLTLLAAMRAPGRQVPAVRR
jgi:uncharacterized membrane protein